MNPEEARKCADQIKGHLEGARGLILDLHERQGWKALGYKSWRECVVSEFDQSKTHLYRQLQAALIEREISPMGEISPIGEIGRIPEGQIRPLAGVPEGQRKEVWERARETAPNGKVTAAHVERTKSEIMGRASSPPMPDDSDSGLELEVEEPASEDEDDDEPEFISPGPAFLQGGLLPEETDEDIANRSADAWTKLLTRFAEFGPTLIRKGGIRKLTQRWTRDRARGYITTINEAIKFFESIRDELKGGLNEKAKPGGR